MKLAIFVKKKKKRFLFRIQPKKNKTKKKPRKIFNGVRTRHGTEMLCSKKLRKLIK